jgi:hypothetical protein
MEQFARCAGCKQPWFWFWLWLKLKSAKPLAVNSAKIAWHVQNRPHKAFMTWKHQSFDPYGENEMVQQDFARCAGCKQPWFWYWLWLKLKSAKPLAINSAKGKWHGMSKISHTGLS